MVTVGVTNLRKYQESEKLGQKKHIQSEAKITPGAIKLFFT